MPRERESWDLKKLIVKNWQSIEQDIVKDSYLSLPRRMQEIADKEGDLTDLNFLAR